MWLIRPKPFHFDPRNIEIHGITPQAVSGESTFGELWSEIAEAISGETLVAHNAAFDIGVLLACLRAHHLSIPDFEFTCTRAIARQTWQHRQRFGLKPLSDWLGIRFQHHDALEDSIACAKVLLAAGIDREAGSLEELESSLRLSRGTAGQWGHLGPKKKSRRSRTRTRKFTDSKKRPLSDEQSSDQHQQVLPFLFPDGSQPQNQTVRETSAFYDSSPPTFASQTRAVDLQRLLIRAEFIRPLNGKQVVICGRLKSLSQCEAETLATRLGGRCQSKVDASTDFVVVGKNEIVKTQFASESQATIVTEEEFLGLLVSQSE
jgi:DNA polymerase-3 subunit epsilon